MAAIVRFSMLPMLLALLLGAYTSAAYGVSQVDVYAFPDETTKARFYGLIAELRCPKCQNTNLAGSDAPIARDLRAMVHRLLVEEGMDDDEIRAFLRARYGDFILYDPPFEPRTWLLWLLPALLLIVALWVVVRLLRAQRQVITLNDTERARLDALKADHQPAGSAD